MSLFIYLNTQVYISDVRLWFMRKENVAYGMFSNELTCWFKCWIYNDSWNCYGRRYYNKLSQCNRCSIIFYLYSNDNKQLFLHKLLCILRLYKVNRKYYHNTTVSVKQLNINVEMKGTYRSIKYFTNSLLLTNFCQTLFKGVI